ncbi:MAG: response regulator [Schaedlerella sp.]|nr:response regulator [Schaedlerella sp.]
MKTILVDDMMLDLQLFELKCADMPEFEIVGKFTNPIEAINYAENHEVDFAVLDIELPGMNGIELAQKLRQIRSDIVIVFATAYIDYAVDAIRMKADYIIFKPFEREDIEDVLERAKLLRQRQKKKVYFQTFGMFDMRVNGKPVYFRSSKAKELLALCVYRNGQPVTNYEMVEILWGEEAADFPEKTGYRRLIKELMDTLKNNHAEEILLRERGSLRMKMELIDSDYMDFLNGRMEACHAFQGEFMKQYSWAEEAVYGLLERKKIRLAKKKEVK